MSTWSVGTATKPCLSSASYELFISVLVSSMRRRVQKEQGLWVIIFLPYTETRAELGSQELTIELTQLTRGFGLWVCVVLLLEVH